MLNVVTSLLWCLYLAFVFSYFWRTSATNTQCDKFKQYCPNDTHTMCKYNGTGKNCNESVSWNITEDDKKAIVDAHNEHRGYVAEGNETRGKPGPQPNASNMMKISWDNDLALVAQRWADQCNSSYDECRNDPRGNVGQSIHFETTGWPYNSSINWREVINKWYNEVNCFPNFDVEFYRPEVKYRHYAQMVWGVSYLVGCGARQYQLHNVRAVDFVCNYYPAGNIPNESVYINGTPCSLCPNDTVCEYPLCVNQTIVYLNKGFFDKIRYYFGNWWR